MPYVCLYRVKRYIKSNLEFIHTIHDDMNEMKIMKRKNMTHTSVELSSKAIFNAKIAVIRLIA